MTGDYPKWYPEEGRSPKPPIKGRYGCTDLTNALNETVLPEFKKWLGVRVKNFSEKYYKNGKAWVKVSAKNNTFRMTAEQVLNHLLPALSGIKSNLKIKVEYNKEP